MKFEEIQKEQQPKRNYYEVLGVLPSASQAEIKKAFRDLVKQTHPDMVGGDTKKEEFLKVQEAYGILSDEKERERYDSENSIRKESGNKKNENGDERTENNDDEDWEGFKREMMKDKEAMLMLSLVKNNPRMEEEFKKYLDSAYKAYKAKKGYEKEMQELQRRQDGLDKMQAELNKGTNFQQKTSFVRKYERNNVRDLDGNLGVEKDILGNEKLIDLKTGRQLGYNSYKRIEYISGVIIASDIIGNKYVLNRKGDHSYDMFRDIIVRDGLVIGKDIIGNEKLIDRNTGKTIGYGSYQKIIKEGGKIYGVNIIGRKEEIKV